MLKKRRPSLIAFAALIFFLNFFVFFGLAFAGHIELSGKNKVFELKTGPSGDAGLIASGEEDFSDSWLLSVKRPFILPEGVIVDTAGGKISFFKGGDTAELKIMDGLVPIDAKITAISPEKSEFLMLLSDGKQEYLHIAKYPFKGKKVVAGADNSCKITGERCSKIIGSEGTGRFLLSLSAMKVIKFEADPGTGSAVKRSEANIDGYGAVMSVDFGGRLLMNALKANAGALNTLITYDSDLKMVSSRQVLTGETGGVMLEAALSGEILVASVSAFGKDGVLRKKYLSIDGLGRVCELFELAAFEYHDQAMVYDGDLFALEAVRPKKLSETTGEIECVMTLHQISRETIEKHIDAYFSKEGDPALKEVSAFEIKAPAASVIGAAVCPDGKSAAVVTKGGLFCGDALAGGKMGEVSKAFLKKIKGAEEVVFGRDGRLYISRYDENEVIALDLDGSSVRSMSGIKIAKTPSGVRVSDMTAGASSEIFFSDPFTFSTVKYSKKGVFEGKLKNLSFVSHGGYAQLFMVSEGADASHKILLEYDDEGNFMRELGDIRKADGGRVGGAFCPGRDKKGRVFLMGFAEGSLIVKAYDYKTGEKIKESAVKFGGVSGIMISRGYAVSDDGCIVFATLEAPSSGVSKVRVYSVDIF